MKAEVISTALDWMSAPRQAELCISCCATRSGDENRHRDITTHGKCEYMKGEELRIDSKAGVYIFRRNDVLVQSSP